ncbi:MAG: hypothetical protein V4631_10585 [Pseudomonadota bacterium]
MRLYVTVTGVLFALLTLAHIARIAMEGTVHLRDPIFMFFTVLAAALSVWAFVSLRRTSA